MLRVVSVFSRVASRFALYLSALGLVLMTVIIGWQVFARYVLDAAPAWTEQAALFLMLWFILLAAAVGVREGFHIRLTLLQETAPRPVSRLLHYTCHAIVGLFGFFMAYSGVDLAIATWEHTIPALNIPRGSAYLPIAFAGGLITFFALEHIWASSRGEEIQPLWN